MVKQARKSECMEGPPEGLCAEYRPSDIEHYRGNPLIEALPPPADEAEVLKTFGRFPTIRAFERKLPRAQRIASVGRLRSYLEPLLCHAELFSSIGWVIREGYANRNPADLDYLKRLAKSYHNALGGDVVPITETSCSTAPSIGLFGMSGVGKSTAIERTLSYFPQVLIHKEFGFTQVVWLKVDCPPDGSLKQLLFNILGRLDLHIKSNYEQIAERAAVSRLIRMVGNLTKMHHVGALIIDEIQHLIGTTPSARENLLRFLINLSNEARIPIVMIGTPIAKHFLEPNFKFARRFGDSGAFMWDRLKGHEWDFFMDGLMKFQWTCGLAKREDISLALYEETQGVHALAVRLFQLCQIDAITTGSEVLASDQIKRVAEKKFSLVRLALRSLRHGRPRRNLDADLQDGIDFLDAEIESDVEKSRIQVVPAMSTRTLQRDRAISSLNELLDLDEKAVGQLVDQILKLQPNLKPIEVVQEAVRAFSEIPNATQTKSVIMKEVVADLVATEDKHESRLIVEAFRAKGIVSK